MNASTGRKDFSPRGAVGTRVVSGTATQSEAAAGLTAAVEELSVSITHVSTAPPPPTTSPSRPRAREQGGATVRQMTDGMNRIADEIDQASAAVNLLSERSARISNIGKIINDIADQTSLLA